MDPEIAHVRDVDHPVRTDRDGARVVEKHVLGELLFGLEALALVVTAVTARRSSGINVHRAVSRRHSDLIGRN